MCPWNDLKVIVVSLLVILLVGCGTEALEERAEHAKTTLGEHGIEVEHGKVAHVIRF